jgi:hypothetical protein
MRISKFIKVDRDILLEYIYDDNNLIGEPYKLLVDIQKDEWTYLSGDSSATKNTRVNQIFQIDSVTNKYGLADTTQYNFLQIKDYAGGFPVKYDTIKLHLPTNYTFGEHIGCHIEVYTYDYDNKKKYYLSKFFYDFTDPNTMNLLDFSTPPLYFQEKLWGKNISINIPSANAISNQREDGRPKVNSINANLTNSYGLSLTAPIFIDFQFINVTQTVNNVKTYILGSKVSVSTPQTPEFERLGVKIEESTQGDFFEIYGTYNDSIGEFKQFIDNSYTLGNRYYAEYVVTMFEQNIKGKTFNFIQYTNFNEKIEFRPIIKFSTTTAIIDVEMRLTDQVDGSVILRRASYGMLQDEVAKYSINLTKINLADANKPKIYSFKNSVGDLSDLQNRLSGRSKQYGNNVDTGASSITVEQVRVPYPVMVDKFNIVAKSDSVKIKNDTWFGLGKLQIMIYPFDNVILFKLASQVDASAVIPMNLINNGDITLVIKNPQISVETPLYFDTGEVDLENGVIIFKVSKNKISDVRRIFESGINVFYITTSANNITTSIYTGTYLLYDSPTNVASLNTIALQGLAAEPAIIDDPTKNKETAIITRKVTLTPGSPVKPNLGAQVANGGLNSTLSNLGNTIAKNIDQVTVDSEGNVKMGNITLGNNG